MKSPLHPLVERPAHIPADLVVPFDFHAPPGGDKDIVAAWKTLQDGPPIVWTPYNGGHWMLTRADDIEFAQKNHDPFSMRRVNVPMNLQLPRMLPLEADPPEHSRFRTIINRFFTPRALKQVQDGARELAISLIEGFKHSGKCEFRRDFALQLPIIVFMRLVDQPLDDMDYLLDLAEKSARPKDPAELVEAFHGIMAYIARIIEERRANPGDDLLSAVATAQVGDALIGLADTESMMITLLFGGLDTVASSLGFAARFLAEHPEHRRQLVDRPELIANAVDEMLRMFAPSATGRTLTRDYDYKGVQFKAGEQVLIRNLMHGIDPAKFADPMRIDWERPALDRTLAAFGNGPHRCPGAALARSELAIFLEEWLKRIPDFTVDPADEPVIGTGMVNSMLYLPLVWDPGSVR